MAMTFEKHDLVDMDKMQSLIKAEWSVIRTKQDPVDLAWRDYAGVTRFDDKCCGMLFYNDYAFASNGHWLARTQVDFTSIDPGVRYFFYNYMTDELQENYNPFEEVYGITMNNMFGILNDWKLYNLKFRVEDLLGALCESVNLVKDRRAYSMHAGFDFENKMLCVRLESKTTCSDMICIPVYDSNGEGFPEFSVNLSYFCKILDIISDYYHVVDLCFNGNDEPLIIKAKNRYNSTKPDLRFALGKFSY